MFDNIPPQPNNNSSTAPTPTANKAGNMKPMHAGEPDDIFAGTDAAPAPSRPKPPQLQPKNAAPMMPAGVAAADSSQPASPPKPPASSAGKIYFMVGVAVIIILVLVLVGMVGLAYYQARQTSVPQSNNQNQTQTITDVSEQNTAADSNEQNDLSYIVDEIKDSDNDGIFDAEEIRLGTDPNKADTDNDGLFDREELRVYQTDPLTLDSDGDGYSDGDEVQNGYNPSGAGKLLELPQ